VACLAATACIRTFYAMITHLGIGQLVHLQSNESSEMKMFHSQTRARQDNDRLWCKAHGQRWDRVWVFLCMHALGYPRLMNEVKKITVLSLLVFFYGKTLSVCVCVCVCVSTVCMSRIHALEGRDLTSKRQRLLFICLCLVISKAHLPIHTHTQ